MRAVGLLVALLLGLPTAAGCSADSGGADEPGGSGGGAGSGSVTLTFEDGQAPAPERVQLGVGEELEVVVQSDEPGSLHVHSSPEQELDFDAGRTVVPITVEEPGVVEVESHELEATVLQLEVS